MPLQNRVTPFGEIETSPARGLLMGNRGVLHDAGKRLGRARWKHPHWIVCVLAFKDRRRELMAPRRYTELFFCDEAVALAVGHRPCFECRREDFGRFASAWAGAQGLGSERPRAGAIDADLHAARISPGGRQLRISRALTDLPDGAFVTLPDVPDEAWLLHDRALHRWSHQGYTERRHVRGVDAVKVLTPEPTLRTLAAGYSPQLHPSALD